MHRDESEERLIHRLEAFSDIVIGFSLAQLGLSLTIPEHARDLFAHVRGVTPLIALVVTFTLVCGVWWLHHRLFQRLFIPNTPNIVANFAALCGVIFLAYSMQVLVHAHFTDPVAFSLYTGSYAWILLLFAFIAWNGMRLRAKDMLPAIKVDSSHLAMRLTIMAVWLMLITVATSIFGVRPEVAQWMFVALAIPLGIMRIVNRKRLREA